MDVWPEMKASVLITSAAQKAPLIRAMTDALTKHRIPLQVMAGDISPNAMAKYISQAFWHMPPTGEAHLHALLDGCAERGIQVILPSRDGELAFWAKHAGLFAKVGVHVIVSSSVAIERCIDKVLFWEFGCLHGLPMIQTSTDIHALAASRFVVKERQGAGSRGVGIDLDHKAALAHASTLDQPIFQPFIKGKEISVDAWADSAGVVKGLVLRHRDVVHNGESCITTTFHDVALEERAKHWVEVFGVRGPVVMQVLLDDLGAAHIIELNARFGGASTASIQVGLDSLTWSVIDGIGGDVSQYPFLRSSSNVRQIRIPTDTHIHGSDF